MEWSEDEVGAIGDVPFEAGYMRYQHDHWLKAKERAQPSYKKLAYALNKLGVQHPVYFVLAAGVAQYGAALYSCYDASERIVAAENAKAEAEKQTGGKA